MSSPRWWHPLLAGGAGRVRLHRAGQRRAGVRDGLGAERPGVAAEERRDRRHAGSGLARRALVPERQAGNRLPGEGDLHGRNVGPGHRPLGRRGAVGSQHLQPVNPRQRLHVSDDPRRHRTGDRRSPADQSGGRAGRAVDVPLPDPADPGCADAELHAAVPDADRVLGLRVCEPGRPGKRHRGARQPDGLRRRRREHARHRLLGRRVRLLRTAAEPRRLRRDRDDRQPAVGARAQGRYVRHLLRRHQPAVHGAAAPARPRGDRAAVGDRRDGDDALPGRHPQRRLRGGLGRTAPAERRTGRPGQRAGMGLRGSKKAIRPARPTRPCTARRRT